MKAGYSAYQRHIPGQDMTYPDVLIRIVAPKVAGSSPVGHPPEKTLLCSINMAIGERTR